ncbi:MAG: Zn-ribbon domain-containing OB-fold protein [Burkholderiaceae bacterium]|nr:Zn-ribbon domain-containing OB-fold protein [Burkholderiaceae bacterium]
MLKSHNREYAAPTRNPEIVPFWEGAKAGRLMIKHCNACGKPHYYPRTICPRCNSDDTVWQAASGKATIYTFSVMRSKEPYAIGFVTLEEGVTLMTNIVDCDLDSIKIGQKVKVVFKPSDGGPPVPMFAPA